MSLYIELYHFKERFGINERERFVADGHSRFELLYNNNEDFREEFESIYQQLKSAESDIIEAISGGNVYSASSDKLSQVLIEALKGKNPHKEISLSDTLGRIHDIFYNSVKDGCSEHEEILEALDVFARYTGI